MMSICNLKEPLPLKHNSLINKIKQACTESDISFFIAGATAREVILTNVHGRPSGRRTRDIDIAIYVASWEKFNVLKDKVIESGAREVAGNAHRFTWDEMELDIIPFGDIADRDTIRWPPEQEIIMSVEGFKEAYKNALVVDLPDCGLVKFCSLPGLLLLKLFAWRDRRHVDKRDASDIKKILFEYSKVEMDRIYDIDNDLAEAVNWDPDRLASILAGCDTASIASEQNIREIKQMDKEQLIDDIATSQDYPNQNRDEVRKITEMVDDFWERLISANLV